MRSPLADIFLPQDRLPQDQLPQRKARPAGLSIFENVPLARYTRFEVGGPARILADAATEAALTEVLSAIIESGERYAIIGGGTNLVASRSRLSREWLCATPTPRSNSRATP